ncbi:hypothetical protein PACTADRAFT_36779 [Pachysolen tannophilus NRRL Y-2460]|uniref:3'(2'),5'-bisphosphate nucleotidase n=1 Tax=Pachysolen tannophilus NRRL Y-2460 TaxID=669874 RepID=A0A1E4U2R0_PACTA|nr:hypothetical protein PACTADRAFT_36779 [Pachysolen tannophilus NRRL Y-2460]
MSTSTSTSITNFSDYTREIEIAQLAVKRASILTKKISDHLSSSETIVKSDNSPVTVGDFAAQAIIINSIKKNFPNDFIVAEENSKDILKDEVLAKDILSNILEIQKEDSENDSNLGKLTSVEDIVKYIDFGNYQGGPKGRFWALDPIDGTKGFIRGDQFAVCLALIEDGKVKLGVIGCPNLPHNIFLKNSEKGGLFTALKDNGSFFQDLYADLKPLNEQVKIKMNQFNFDNAEDLPKIKIVEGVEKGHSSHDVQLKIKQLLNIATEKNTVRFDSQVKYCCLSKGDADIYLRLPKSMEYEEKIWDHAAGNILITESGGIVSDMLGNELNFGEGRTLKSKGIIAASKDLHPKVIEAVEKVFKNAS